MGPQICKPTKIKREIKECLHFQNTKQITINNLFNKLAAVAADASMGLQICGPILDTFYNGNVHYKMEGVTCGRVQLHEWSATCLVGYMCHSFMSSKLHVRSLV